MSLCEREKEGLSWKARGEEKNEYGCESGRNRPKRGRGPDVNYSEWGQKGMV